jgi:hypothetical protein
MLRRVILPLLLLATACDDPIAAPPSSRGPTVEIDDGFQTVTGMVVSEHELRSYESGELIPLLGPQTELLRGLTGAEIKIRGSADEIGATPLWIVEFRVLTVDGLTAFDGTLGEYVDGFAVDTSEGKLEFLASIPDDLMVHVGKRVWLTTRDGSCVRYGVLEMSEN